MENLVEQLKKLWNGMGTIQKVVLIGVPTVLVIGAMGAIIFAVNAPAPMVPLFNGLEAGDAALITEELNKEGVSYELANNGQDILVPAASVNQARIDLAAMGLPKNHVGFELFDKNELGLTESGFRTKEQRAIQGELARTLESMEQVDKASVLLNIAPETSFLNTDSHSSASVMLTMAQGAKLNERQVEGAKHLVSRAVPRLSIDDVTIVDQWGSHLTGRENEEEGELLASLDIVDKQRKISNRVAEDLEKKVLGQLETIYGSGRVAPSVSVDIDFSKMSRDRELYSPVIGDQGIESHVVEHRSREKGTGEETGGVPGTTSNIPGYLGVSAAEQTTSESSEYDLDVTYLVNKEVTAEDLPPGAIIKRSASVAISTDVWDDQVKESLENIVANAIGADRTKGDEVFVQAFEFSDTTAAAVTTAFAVQSRSRTVTQVAGWLIALVSIVMLMMLMRSVVKIAMPAGFELAGAAAGPAGARLDMIAEEEADQFTLKHLDEVTASQQDIMRQEIDRMIENAPDQVLALLRTWMLEDK